MLSGHKSFGNRLNGIEKAHRSGSRRQAYVVKSNGKVVMRRKRRTPDIPIKGLFYLFLGLAVFKAIVMAHSGLPNYIERVETLRSGTIVEQAGAVAMQPDRISMFIAAQIAPFLR